VPYSIDSCGEPLMGSFGRQILPEWFFGTELTFLNHGAYGAVPRLVFAAQEHWRQKLERQPVEFIDEVLSSELTIAGDQLSRHIGASSGHLAFACNTSEAISGVAHSLTWAPGDEVLVTDHTHSGVFNIFSYLCSRAGAKLRKVVLPWPVNSVCQIIDAIKPYLSERVRLAVFDHVSSRHSVVMPLKRLVSMCHARGISVLVDGAHAPGMLKLQTSEIGADWYVGNCHKWLLAPRGSAFLVTQPEKQLMTHPAVISTTFGQSFWSEFAWTGTRDPSSWLSVPAALEFWRGLGVREGRRYMCSLADWAGDQLVSDWGTERGAAGNLTGAMITVRAPEKQSSKSLTPKVLHDWLLREHNIEVPVYSFDDSLWLRISVHVYNNEADIMQLSQALRQYSRG
jgi:isopenicillin-N epimerase